MSLPPEGSPAAVAFAVDTSPATVTDYDVPAALSARSLSFQVPGCDSDADSGSDFRDGEDLPAQAPSPRDYPEDARFMTYPRCR